MGDKSETAAKRKLNRIAALRRELDKCVILPKDRRLMRERLERQTVKK